MKKLFTLGAVSLVASALLVGCGSSSSSTDSVLETGYFIDAAVANCDYETTSGQKGKTDRYGKFQYKKGDKVKFSLGGLNLGEATPASDGLVTPATLTDNEDDKVRLLRVLQALDADNDPSNGITISNEVITALENLAQEKNISDLNSDKEILDLHSDLALALDEDHDGEIDVNDTEATTHFETSKEKWDSGKKPDDNAEHGNGNGNGNGHGNGNGNSEEEHGTGNSIDLSKYPNSNLTPEIINSLAYMGNEERLAYDIYTVLAKYHEDNGEEIKQLKNIPEKSEIKHIAIVRDLIKKYDINITDVQDVTNPVADKDVAFENMPTGKYDITAIQDLYDTLYDKGIASKQAALEVGCMVEVVDVDDLDKYITQAKEANATDVVDAFNILRNGSYNHYWAFDKGLKNMGVEAGCGVLGAEYIKDYPQNKKGGKGHGK